MALAECDAKHQYGNEECSSFPTFFSTLRLPRIQSNMASPSMGVQPDLGHSTRGKDGCLVLSFRCLYHELFRCLKRASLARRALIRKGVALSECSLRRLM